MPKHNLFQQLHSLDKLACLVVPTSVFLVEDLVEPVVHVAVDAPELVEVDPVQGADVLPQPARVGLELVDEVLVVQLGPQLLADEARVTVATQQLARTWTALALSPLPMPL